MHASFPSKHPPYILEKQILHIAISKIESLDEMIMNLILIKAYAIRR